MHGRRSALQVSYVNELTNKQALGFIRDIAASKGADDADHDDGDHRADAAAHVNNDDGDGGAAADDDDDEDDDDDDDDDEQLDGGGSRGRRGSGGGGAARGVRT
jgi:hypothetical protein